MKTVFRLLLIILIFHAPVWATELSPTWYSKSADNQVVINIEMFMSSTCPHCQKADAFFRDIESKHPDLHIQRYYINQDKNALTRFYQLLSEQQMDDFSVPSIFFCNSRWVGFESAETTGKDLLQAINYCKQQIEKKGTLTQATVNALRHLANANRFITGLIEKPSRLRFTITIAFMDSFSPCAFFCFAGFLAFLLIETQKKKQLIASLLFIFSVAVVHYFQQVYTNAFFELLPWLRIPAALLGIMTLYFVMYYLKKQASGTLYFLLAFLLGLITTIYQQTCVMNWSTIFEQWLNDQHVTTWQASMYQLLYQGVYILPLILILVVYFALLKIGRFAALKTKLVNIGLLFMIAIAVSLIAYPYVLSCFGISMLTLFILMVCGYFLNLT
ncbi:glutaredoxin family protein [Legionella steigerwaltii]|nr:thioredoxin family protein [Legionella steigerwaltii]